MIRRRVEEDMGQFTRGRRVPGAGAGGAAGQGEVHPRLPGDPFDAGAIAQRRVPQGPRAGVPGFLRLADPPGDRPLRLAELRGQGLVGHRAGRARRLGEFLRPGREGALLRGPRREPERDPADAERGAVAARRAARLRRLPRRPAIHPAAKALAGRRGGRPAGWKSRPGAPRRSPTRRSSSRCGTPSAFPATARATSTR